MKTKNKRITLHDYEADLNDNVSLWDALKRKAKLKGIDYQSVSFRQVKRYEEKLVFEVIPIDISRQAL